MTKISTYIVDEKVTALDKWIGSDANMQNRTKNFTPKKLAAYFNEDQVINIGTPLQYKYYTLDPLEARPNGTLTFETEIGPTVNFSAITTFLLSKYTTKQNIVSDFLNFLDGSKVLLFKSSDINSFGFYRISSLEPYEPDPNFFIVTVAYETGNGSLEEDEDYMISLVSLAGDFIPTKTSELINDGDDGVNPFISELDINRTEWDEAYEGKINSAEVTGTTTKTLTLTKQDGGTIEASWTDDNTDAVTSVFGRIGDIVAENGDYTTDQVTEGSKLYLTNSRVIESLLTGYTPSFGNITSSDTVLTAIEKLSGNVSSGYVPYTGATQDVNLGNFDIYSSKYWLYDAPNNNYGSMHFTDGNYHIEDADGHQLFVIEDGFVSIHKNETIQSNLYTSGLTAIRDHYLPDASGTLALTTDIHDPITIGTANGLSLSGQQLSLGLASSTLNGALSSTDWNTFNNKQQAGNYITSLTGEVTASGPGAAASTLNNASVTGKILSGVNITGGTILDTDTMLTAFGKLQNQINSLIGGSIYQGVWNANTNNPILTSSVGTDGNYYIVNVAGSTNLNGITDWKIGDWAIFHGGTWQKVDNTDAVSSVNGFTGAVSLTTDNVPEGTTNLYFTNTRVSANTDVAANTAARHNAVTIGTANGLSLSTQSLSLGLASTSATGALSSTDWNTFNNKQNALTNPVTGTGGDTEVAFFNSSGSTITSHPSIKIVGGQLQTASLKVSTFGAGMVYSDSVGDVGTLTGTINTLTYWSSAGTIGSLSTGAYPSLTEISYVKGVESSIQIQLNGKQNALTNPITGTGTTNYIPKFTGSTALGNSLIYDNGTNVGIGTSSPAEKLSVSGAIISTGGITGHGANRTSLSQEGSNGAYWQSYGADASTVGTFNLRQATSDFSTNRIALHINSVGNIGIGTTSPSFILQTKAGSGFVGAAFSSSYAATSIIGNDANSSWFGQGTNGLGSAYVINNTIGYAQIELGGSPRFYVNSSGNVGIGTTSPNSKIQVLGVSGDPTLTAGTAAIATFTPNGVGTELVMGSSASSPFTFWMQNRHTGINGLSYPIALNPLGGNVGIGTTSPSEKLEVSGNIKIGAGNRLMFSSTAYMTPENNVSGAEIATGGILTIKTGGTTERLRVDASGNVGIGTTSPSAKLDVTNTSAGSLVNNITIQNASNTTSTEAGIFFAPTTATGNIRGARITGIQEDGNNAIGLKFYTGLGATISEKMRITSGGNVGIGTTSPVNPLTVQSNGSAQGIAILNRSSDDFSNLLFYNYAGSSVLGGIGNSSGRIRIMSGGVGDTYERLSITSGGNVGIGTTSPNYSTGGRTVVDINGTSQSMLALSVGGVGKGFLFHTGTDLLVSNEGNGAIKLNTNGSQKVVIEAGGNVGIGTTSPRTPLEVFGNGLILSYSTSNAAARDYLIATNYNAFGDFVINQANANGGNPYSAGTTRFAINASGNVGIGTTDPKGILDVREANRVFDGYGNLNIFTTGADAQNVGGSIALGGPSYGGTTPYPFAKIQGIKEGGAAWSGAMIFGTTQSNSAVTEKMRITSSGNVGIGTTSPVGKLSVIGDIIIGQYADSITNNLDIRTNRALFTISPDGVTNGNGTNISYSWANGGQGPLKFSSASGEVMRLSSGGDVLVGMTSTSTSGVGSMISQGSAFANLRLFGTGLHTFSQFFLSGTAIGSITGSGSITSYNITSDYRLKQDFKQFNGLDLVSKIKVYDYAWKANNSRMNGVIAHELQEVVPYAVTGEKDAEQMQQVDYSKLVPILVQAIQELKAEIEILKNK